MTPWSRLWWAGPLALGIVLVVGIPSVVWGLWQMARDRRGGREPR